MYELTEADARRFIEEAVAERGEGYQYRSDVNGICYYTDIETSADHGPPTRPGCLIGVVLHKVGVSLVKLRNFDGAPVGEFFGYLVHADGSIEKKSNYRARLVDAPEPVVQALTTAQRTQDHGAAWGMARDQFNSDLDRALVGS